MLLEDGPKELKGAFVTILYYIYIYIFVGINNKY